MYHRPSDLPGHPPHTVHPHHVGHGPTPPVPQRTSNPPIVPVPSSSSASGAAGGAGGSGGVAGGIGVGIGVSSAASASSGLSGPLGAPILVPGSSSTASGSGIPPPTVLGGTAAERGSVAPLHSLGAGVSAVNHSSAMGIGPAAHPPLHGHSSLAHPPLSSAHSSHHSSSGPLLHGHGGHSSSGMSSLGGLGSSSSMSAAAVAAAKRKRAAVPPPSPLSSKPRGPPVQRVSSLAPPYGAPSSMMGKPMISMAGAPAIPPQESKVEPLAYDTVHPFSGVWRLNKKRSESMGPPLQAMGVTETAQKAADKLDIVLVIEQSDTECVTSQRTQLGTKSIRRKFGDVVTEEAFDGSLRRANTQYDPRSKVLNIVTTFSGGEITDVRHIEDNGMVMVQQLTLVLPGKPAVCTKRYYNRTHAKDINLS